jgi:hypothetical protein
MTRGILCATALLVACGDSKPKADTLASAPDTVKPAVIVSAPDTMKPIAPATKTKSTSSKTATKTKASGGVRPDEVGRDRAVIPKGGIKPIQVPKDTHPD